MVLALLPDIKQIVGINAYTYVYIHIFMFSICLFIDLFMNAFMCAYPPIRNAMGLESACPRVVNALG